jgi:hypothetical protein
MDDELKQALGAIENQFVAMNTHLVELEDRLVERIHDTETKLLNAFYDWARPTDSPSQQDLTCS